MHGDAPEPGWTTAGTITRVFDGDSVEVELRRRIPVRLPNCWAPESRLDPQIKDPAKREAAKRLGQIAKAHLQILAQGRQCRLVIPASIQPDGYTQDPADSLTLGRAIGEVWIEGPDGSWVSLSELMVAAGHAGRTKAEQPQP
jgi:endonuclease YncB( thermonuclease family)